MTNKEKGQLQCCRGSERCFKDVILLLLDCLEDEKKKNKSCVYVQSKVQEACFADKFFGILPSKKCTLSVVHFVHSKQEGRRRIVH